MKPLYILILIVMMPVLVFSQHYKKDSKKDHKQVESLFVAHITSELELTPVESQAFWAVYNQYREVNDEVKHKSRPDLTQIKTDAEAEVVLNDLIKNDRRRFEVKTKLYSDLSEIISPMKIIKLKAAEHTFRKKMFDKMRRTKG